MAVFALQIQSMYKKCLSSSKNHYQIINVVGFKCLLMKFAIFIIKQSEVKWFIDEQVLCECEFYHLSL